MKTIFSFDGQYRFLSNFYICPVEYAGLLFSSAEAAYQAAKTTNRITRVRMQDMLPAVAKRYGRLLPLRARWNEKRNGIMKVILRDKFTRNQELREKLIDTGKAVLEEGNTWGDKYWGICLKTGDGENHLGKILMELREDLR